MCGTRHRQDDGDDDEDDEDVARASARGAEQGHGCDSAVLT